MVVQIDITGANALELKALLLWIFQSRERAAMRVSNVARLLCDVGEQALMSEIARRMSDAAPRAVYVTIPAESLQSKYLRLLSRSCKLAAKEFTREPAGATTFLDAVAGAAIQTLRERGASRDVRKPSVG